MLASMIRHILLLQPRTDAEPREIEQCRAAITQLVGVVPGLLNCHWGENVAPSERREGFSHAFSMDFSDQSSLDAYGPHPEHKKAATLVRATFERILVVDLPL